MSQLPFTILHPWLTSNPKSKYRNPHVPNQLGGIQANEKSSSNRKCPNVPCQSNVPNLNRHVESPIYRVSKEAK